MEERPPRKLIAVIGHDACVSDSLQFSLEAAGFEVRVFESAADALLSPDTDPADCMVIDDDLPGMDGIDLVRALRRRRPQLPSILLVADPTPQRRREAKAVGAEVVETLCLGDTLVRSVEAALTGAPEPA